ncbi:hypothetical protein SE18_05950 [Herpetosiphon geysericola]|uniref:Uncharacterized protein n=1 Tax=Herpetosiphon geysericola TaxID=70996 RepID=A0A0P6Y3T4_9CHLR|nr:hypothetical protein SE18_05950 [Herpetosiphon geysericola]
MRDEVKAEGRRQKSEVRRQKEKRTESIEHNLKICANLWLKNGYSCNSCNSWLKNVLRALRVLRGSDPLCAFVAFLVPIFNAEAQRSKG